MPSALQGGGHEELGRALRRVPGRQHGGDGLVVELVTESVGADEEPVPGGHRNAVEVRDAGVGDATAQRPGDDVAAGVAARLLGGELTGLDENLDPGVVAGDLGEHVTAQQVDPGVPDVEDDPGRTRHPLLVGHPGQDDAGDRGARQVGGVGRDRHDRLLRGHHRTNHRVDVGDGGPGQRVEGVEGHLRGHTAGGVPAHAIDDDEGRSDGEVAVLVDRPQTPHVSGRTDNDLRGPDAVLTADHDGIGISTNVLGHRLPFPCVACTPLVNPSTPSGTTAPPPRFHHVGARTESEAGDAGSRCTRRPGLLRHHHRRESAVVRH